jgi:hypothetical protein
MKKTDPSRRKPFSGYTENYLIFCGRFTMPWTRAAFLLITVILITGCVPNATPAAAVATHTPDPCTGWECELSGVVYYEEALPGQEAERIDVTLEQVSHCSPTRGEQQTVTSKQGEFTFQVFLHDTDSFWFEINLEGYQPVRASLGGFDCLYCACQPLEIILLPEE